MSLKQKTLIVSLGFLAVFILFGALALYPLFENIRESSIELVSGEKELAAMTEKNRQLLVWEEQQPALEPEIARVKSVFVNPEMPIAFLEFLEKTAQDKGLEIRVSLLGSREDEGLMDFRISLTGPFPDCLKFLDKLENAPYLVDVLTLSVIDSSGAFSDKVEFNLSIKTFASNFDEF